MSKIRWDYDEKNRLGTAALPLLVADGKLTVVEALRRVQDTVLQEGRRRNLTNIGMVPTDLRATLEQRRDAATGKAETVPAAQLAEAVERAERAEQAAAAADGEVERLQAKVSGLEAHIRTLEAHPAPTEIEVLATFCSRVLADALAKGKELPGVRMENGVRPPPLVEQPAAVSTNGKHNPEPRRDGDRARLPKILICGLRPDQRAHLESKFSGRAIIKFYWTNDSHGGQRLKEKAMGCDMAYLMMGSISHSDAAMVTNSSTPYQRVQSNGVLPDLLDAFVSKWAPAGASA